MNSRMFRNLGDIFNAALQPTRAALEYASLSLGWDKLKDAVPAGDGHPVLFLPGFLGDDHSLEPLRACAANKGYKTYGWEKGVNFGFRAETARHLRQRLQQVYRANKGRKVTLVGHSLGGVYARELAREYPHMVRGVITLGSPFGMLGDLTEAASSVVRALYDFLNPQASPLNEPDAAQRCLTPPPVPTTSIYSKSDGVINYRASLNPKGPLAENIQVDGGHTGLAFNRIAIVAALDRLAQPEGAWKRFDRRHYRKIFPKTEPHSLPSDPRWKHQGKPSIFKATGYRRRHG
jgi:pimeloyl-ACP methyl ester carboxylesterase